MSKKHFANTYITLAAILLSCVGTVSIGFATWIISQDDSSTASGVINADAFDTNIKGLGITASTPLTFAHYHYISEGSLYDYGTLTYTISFDVSEINATSLNILGSLSFSDSMPIFKELYMSDYGDNSIKAITYDGNEIPSSSINFLSNSTGVEFAFTQSIGENDFNKSLSFTFNNKLIAKYGQDLIEDGKTFFLRLEAE